MHIFRRETGNQGPGNFPREMEDREKSGNREKSSFSGPKMSQKTHQIHSNFGYIGIGNDATKLNFILTNVSLANQ